MNDKKNSQKKELSVIIVNWNSCEYLTNCIKSLYNTCRSIDLQIIVVDSASYDGSQKKVRDLFPKVQFVQLDKNIGFGRSNNKGFSFVVKENLLLLNPDTIVKSRSIETLLDVLNSEPFFGIIGAKLIQPNGELQYSSVRALPTPINRALDSEFLQRLLPESNLWKTHKAYTSNIHTEVEAVDGACMMMKTDNFRKVNMFSEKYFMYGEDMDLCAKFLKIGLKNIYVPYAEVIHYGGASSSTRVDHFATINMRRSNLIFMEIHYSKFIATIYRLLQAISSLIRIMFSIPMLVVRKNDARKKIIITISKWWTVFKWSIGTMTNNIDNS